MSEALIGVVVGGLIAALVQFVTAWTGEKRWQLELRLSHLKAERGRLEKIFEESLKSFGEGMANNSERSPDEMQCNPGHFRIRPLLPGFRFASSGLLV